MLCLGGCGTEAIPVPEVRGTVKYRGQPLRQGVVAIVSDPQRSRHQVLAVGIIETDGCFTLRREEGGGILPGWYRVSVLSIGEPRLPEHYSDPNRSGLFCQVVPDGDNRLCLQLE